MIERSCVFSGCDTAVFIYSCEHDYADFELGVSVNFAALLGRGFHGDGHRAFVRMVSSRRTVNGDQKPLAALRTFKQSWRTKYTPLRVKKQQLMPVVRQPFGRIRQKRAASPHCFFLRDASTAQHAV